MKTASFRAVVEARKAATRQLSYYKTMVQGKEAASTQPKRNGPEAPTKKQKSK